MASPAAVLNILLTANTAQANAALAKTQGQLVTTGKTATATSATFKKAMLGIGLAAGAAATALFKIGDEFDQVSDKIRTQTGASGKELDKLERNFKKVVSSVPTDFESASDAIAGLNQRLDLTGRPLVRLTKRVTQLSIVTGTDVKENVEAVTRLFGDWEVKTKDQVDTLDGLFRISQKTGGSVSDLARDLVQFGAPLRNLGIDMDFAAAMFGNFEKTGVNMTTVLSGLRLGVGNLNSPTDDLKKALDKLGISTKNPEKALTEIFDAIKTLDKQAATALGIEAFGKRAGPDLVDTVRGGKFELDKLIGTFRDGDDTISKAEKSTRDFSEQWTLFVNRAKVFLEPVATAFFKAVGDAMKALNRLDLKKAIQSIKDFWQSAGLLRETFAKVGSAIKDNLRGLTEFIRGAVKVISGVLTGNFSRAWDGIKDIFKAGARNVVAIFKAITAPIRVVAEKIAEVLKDVFGGAWKEAANVVDDAANAIMGSMHRMTNTVNKGFRQVFKFTNEALKSFGVQPVAFSLANAVAEGAASQGKQKGGIIGAQRGVLVPGRGTGDKVPAMLEPGEVVLNRRAVAAMGGARRANRINRMIPRFASGGVIQQALGPYSIPPIQYDPNHAGGNSHLHLDFFTQAQAIAYGKKMQGMGWSVGEYSGPYGGFGPLTTTHQSPGHYDGTAFDANTAADETRAEVAAVARLLTGKGGGGAVAAVAEKIARVLLKGPAGPLKDFGQAALDKVRNAANAYIGKQAPRMQTTGSDGFPADVSGSIAAYAQRMVSRRWGPDQWPPFLNLKVGESGPTWDPTITNPTSGAGGIPQALPPSKMGSPAWPPTQGKVSAMAQVDWMGDYINSVYGTPASAYGTWLSRSPHWYSTGGIVGAAPVQSFASGGIVQHFKKGGHPKPGGGMKPPWTHFNPGNFTTPWTGTGAVSGPGGGRGASPSFELQLALLDVAMADASQTATVADDFAILKKRGAVIRAQIRKVSKMLAKKGLSPARRLALTQQLASLKGDLNAVTSEQTDLTTPTTSNDGINPNQQAQLDAMAAQTEVLNALKDAATALKEEIAAQNNLVTSALASDYTQALAYIGDLLSGAIGGRVEARLHTAGYGSVVNS